MGFLQKLNLAPLAENIPERDRALGFSDLRTQFWLPRAQFQQQITESLKLENIFKITKFNHLGLWLEDY